MMLTLLWLRSWFGGVAWGVTLSEAAVLVSLLISFNKSESIYFFLKCKYTCNVMLSGNNGVFPFCDERGRIGCTVDRLSVGQCNRITPTSSAIASQFQVYVHGLVY